MTYPCDFKLFLYFLWLLRNSLTFDFVKLSSGLFIFGIQLVSPVRPFLHLFQLFFILCVRFWQQGTQPTIRQTRNNQSINQSISQSIDRSINQTINQLSKLKLPSYPTDQAPTQRIAQTPNQTTLTWSVRYPVNWLRMMVDSIFQPTDQSIHPSVKQLITWHITESSSSSSSSSTSSSSSPPPPPSSSLFSNGEMAS